MRRSSFLKRAAAAVGGAVIAGRLPESAVAASAASGAADVAPGLSAALESSGGLCLPLPPFYQLHAFAAPRGEILYSREPRR